MQRTWSTWFLIASAVAGGLITTGCKGPPGPAGTPGGLSGYEVVVAETPGDATEHKQLGATCPEGKRALGAGWSVLDNTSAILNGTATFFEPEYDGTGWLVNAENNTVSEPQWKLRVRLICADATP